MATGLASNFKIYNNQFFGGLVEQLQQDTSALGSVGIKVAAKPMKGDFELQSFIKKITGITSRRDTTSVATATDLAVTMDENISVKLNRKIGPVAQTLDAWKKAALPFATDFDVNGAQAFSRYIGGMIAKDIGAEMLNTSLLAGRTFLEGANGGSNLFTIAANGTMTTAALISSLATMGDSASRIQAWVMHSKVYFDLLQFQVASGNGANAAYGVIQAAMPLTLNRPVYVTDSPSLLVTGTPNLYRTLGLVDTAIEMNNSEEQTVVLDTVTGLENLVSRMQGEFAYNLAIKGAKWDTVNGGANPSASAVGTFSNWDQCATSNKDFAGCVIISG